MTDGPPWLQLPLCCLPPSSEYLVPQGSDQKAQAGLSLLLWKAVDTEGENWEVQLRKKLGAKSRAPFFSPREAWEQLLLRSSLPSCFPCLQLLEEQGQGEQEILIYHIGAVVSSSFIAWSDLIVECVKCVDFVECAQKECGAQRPRVTQSVPLLHGTRTQAGHFDSSLTSEINSSQSSFSLACICLSTSLPSSL